MAKVGLAQQPVFRDTSVLTVTRTIPNAYQALRAQQQPLLPQQLLLRQQSSHPPRKFLRPQAVARPQQQQLQAIHSQAKHFMPTHIMLLKYLQVQSPHSQEPWLLKLLR